MSDKGHPDASTEAVEKLLRAELAHGDGVIATTGPIVRHMLLNDANTLFTDEVMAHIRGMIGNIARQLMSAVAEDVDAARDAFFDQRVNTVAGILLDDPTFLTHIHALAIESQISERMKRGAGIDPVRSPLMQELAASSDEEIAGIALRALAAQARFVQQQRRMEFALSELPPELFAHALDALDRALIRDQDAAHRAMELLRESYLPAHRRTQQLSELIETLDDERGLAFEVSRAGIAIFVTALAAETRQSRENLCFALSEKQSVRLALSLRAAGQSVDLIEEQLLVLHPNKPLPGALGTISPERASAMLATPPATVEA